MQQSEIKLLHIPSDGPVNGVWETGPGNISEAAHRYY